jgi:ATP-dependent exoDNAse (exonuclease V) alpha subunit
MGDRHQLPAVGRGGVLDLAGRWARPGACLTLNTVHRFADPAYADLSLLMRTGERSGEVFDALLKRGQVVVHGTEVERRGVVAESRAADVDRDQILIADTREEVAELNQLVRDRLIADGRVDDTRAVTTRSGQRLGVGDRVTTRRNDPEIGVANRDVWTVEGLEADGAIRVTGSRGSRLLPAQYVAADLELSYATTAYGAQGSTVTAAHTVVCDQTSAASAYVAMTRGRHENVAHLVADTVDDARTQWIDVFARDRADLGPAHAAAMAREALERYGSQPRSHDAALQRAALRGSLDLTVSSGRRQSAAGPTRQTPGHSPPAL